MLKIFLGYICWKQFQDFSAGKHCSVHVDTRPARQLFRAVVVLGTGKSEGARRVFGRICPNFPEKLLCHLPTNFLPQRPSRPFFVWHARKGLHVFFCKRWAPFFLNQTTLGVTGAWRLLEILGTSKLQ